VRSSISRPSSQIRLYDVRRPRAQRTWPDKHGSSHDGDGEGGAGGRRADDAVLQRDAWRFDHYTYTLDLSIEEVQLIKRSLCGNELLINQVQPHNIRALNT